MSANVILTPNFEREAKKLVKKYRSLKNELLSLTKELEENPTMGIQIKENVYKIRLAVRSKGKGKSGGMRVITYVETELIEKEDELDVYLLSIYDKSDQKNISDKLINQIVDEIQSEIEDSISKEAAEIQEEE